MRRSHGYDHVEAREGEDPTPPPLTPEEDAYQAELAKLQSYRDKVIIDLERSQAQLDAEILAMQAKKNELGAQQLQVLAEYNEREAALGPPPASPRAH